MRGNSVPPPPAAFATVNIATISAGSVLHRTHATVSRPGQFNPCLGQPTRFAPFADVTGTCVPSLYAATSREAAASPDLKAWGIARTNLTEIPKSTYLKTALWARRLHSAYPDIKSLFWTSRQCDPESCLIDFGDRVRQSDFDVLDCFDVA